MNTPPVMHVSPFHPNRPLRVGVQLPEVEREVRWPEYVAMARRAEDLGFDTIWVGDHLLYRFADGSTRGPWEVWTLLAAIAASTTRIRLGPLVASTAFHAPAMLAKLAATVDEISGGRLILGLGAGWNETEFRAFGFPFDHRVDRFEETRKVTTGIVRRRVVIHNLTEQRQRVPTVRRRVDARDVHLHRVLERRLSLVRRPLMDAPQ